VKTVLATPLLKEFSASAQAFLKANGDEVIKAIAVCRTPLGAGLNKVLDLITRGGWEEAKKSLNMDKLYHTFMRVTYGDKVVVIEKNDRPQFTKSQGNMKRENEERINVDVRDGLTINKMMSNAIGRVGHTKFFVYDAFSTNCQRFLNDCLTSSPQIAYTAGVKAFVMQDAKGLLEKQPKVIGLIAKAATNLVNKAKHAYTAIPDVAAKEVPEAAPVEEFA
jgi:hypothetical protein